MAGPVKTFQYKQTMSINRDEFTKYVVKDNRLSKKDLRVLCHLLTHLDAIVPKEISKKNIAYDLDIRKKDVDDSIENLIYYEILIRSSSGSVKNGYMLAF